MANLYLISNRQLDYGWFEALCLKAAGSHALVGWEMEVPENVEEFIVELQRLDVNWLIILARSVKHLKHRTHVDSIKKLHQAFKKRGLENEIKILAIAEYVNSSPRFHIECLKAGATEFFYGDDLDWDVMTRVLRNREKRGTLDISHLTLLARSRGVRFGDCPRTVHCIDGMDARLFKFLYFIGLQGAFDQHGWLSSNGCEKVGAIGSLWEPFNDAMDRGDIAKLKWLHSQVPQLLKDKTYRQWNHNLEVTRTQINGCVKAACYRVECPGIMVRLTCDTPQLFYYELVHTIRPPQITFDFS